jgi:hypothetical protein
LQLALAIHGKGANGLHLVRCAVVPLGGVLWDWELGAW